MDGRIPCRTSICDNVRRLQTLAQPSTGSRLPRWLPSAFILAAAALLRLPHYDVAWFGLDQVYFMADARRALAGGEAGGPLASGLDIVGPLYTYLLAGLTWIRDDPAFLTLFSATCEVIACWLVYDTSRRLAGSSSAGLGAALTYATTPVLVFGTRLIWNPGLLPALVSLGWWLTVRHRERPSTLRLAALALAAGLTIPLHPTGVFHGAAWMLVALATRPSLAHVAVAAAVGLLPLLPVLLRLIGSASDVGALGTRLTMTGEPRLVLSAVEGMTLHFPKAFGEDWTTTVSTGILHAQAAIAAAGLVLGWIGSGGWRPVWLGIGLSIALNVTSALFYAGPLSWHYFMALMPALCLCIGHAIASARRWRPVVALALSVLAAAQLVVLDKVDRLTITTGMIKINPRWLAGGAGSDAEGYSLSVREMGLVGRALQGVMPDGATALAAAHGIRAEIWRETGAEFMTPSHAADASSRLAFMLTGPGAAPLRSDARLIADRVCLFDRPTAPSWRFHHAALPAGWERPDLADGDWSPLELPRRIPHPSRGGPLTQLSTWGSSHLLLRGRFTPASPDGRHLFAVVVRSAGSSAHWIGQAFVNGTPVALARSRVVYSTLNRYEEWLIDATKKLQPAENLIALMIDGQTSVFDLDVFEVPCLDADWYR